MPWLQFWLPEMNKYSFCILGAGSLWGLMGLFTRQFTERGFSSANTVFIRSLSGCLFFALAMLIADRKAFKIKLRDIWCFLGGGLCSLLFFTVCYFQAIRLCSLSVAAILLYTAPSFVMLMSIVLFGEKMTGRKVAALIMAFLGCCFVSGLGGGITAMGFVYGICAGFGYALYTVFSRFAMLRGYNSFTINFYSSLFCGLGAGLIWGVEEPIRLATASGDIILFSLFFGFVVSFLPYMLYTQGLIGTENGKASVMASIEPVVATLVGIFVFNEKMDILCAAGVLLVLGAIAVLNSGKKVEEKCEKSAI